MLITAKTEILKYISQCSELSNKIYILLALEKDCLFEIKLNLLTKFTDLGGILYEVFSQ